MTIFTRLMDYLTHDVAMSTASHEIAHGLMVIYYGMTVHDMVIGSLGRGGYCTFDLPASQKHQLVVYVAGYVEECILKGKTPDTYVHGSGTDGDSMLVQTLVGRQSDGERIAINHAYALLTKTGVQEYIKEKATVLVADRRMTGLSIKYPGRKYGG
jgi:hypothetical protein